MSIHTFYCLIFPRPFHTFLFNYLSRPISHFFISLFFQTNLTLSHIIIFPGKFHTFSYRYVPRPFHTGGCPRPGGVPYRDLRAVPQHERVPPVSCELNCSFFLRVGHGAILHQDACNPEASALG